MKRTNSPNLRVLGAGCAAALAALALAACGGYDQGEAENTIVDKLSGQVDSAVGSPITSASCPSDVELKAGTTFDCTATLENGDELTWSTPRSPTTTATRSSTSAPRSCRARPAASTSEPGGRGEPGSGLSAA